MPTRTEMILTLDGSPTLEFVNSEGYVEAMHNRKGALTETLYLYDQATLWLLPKVKNLHAFSLGLGVGYIETMLVARLLAEDRLDNLVSLVSTESDERLRISFMDWLRHDSMQTEFVDSRNLMLAQTAAAMKVKPVELKQAMRELLIAGSWEFWGEHRHTNDYGRQFQLIFYDAFSQKMDPELWCEQNLVRFFSRHTADICIFKSYAATGALNRALKSTGFRLEKTLGFGGKRESTAGYRDCSVTG